jgi:hypothetical protein
MPLDPRAKITNRVNSGIINTPKGKFTWTVASDGTVHAEGNGQELKATGTDASDGSSTSHTEYSLVGQSPYLTIDFAANNPNRQVEVTLRSRKSQLRLAIANIDASGKSGTATVSGTLGQSRVNWKGPVDLTSNPLRAGAVAGLPKGAFATELQRAAPFVAVAKAVAGRPKVTTGSAVAKAVGGRPKATTGGTDPVVVYSVGGVIERAGAWCVGGAVASSELGPGAVLGCVGGAAGSLLSEFGKWWDEGDVEAEPPPPFDIPPSPEPTEPDTETSHEDPPPPPSGGDSGTGDSGGDSGGGGGGDPDDTDDTPHEKD